MSPFLSALQLFVVPFSCGGEEGVERWRLMMLFNGIEQDEREAIDKKNILGERTRKAKPPGTYAEPSDEQMMGMK